jgi:23S rRNA (cytidine2498-2'-O)-methyltransferase
LKEVSFAQDVWLEPTVASFESINDAVKILLGVNKHWFLYPFSHVRRSRLIEKKLRGPFKKPLVFPVTQVVPTTGVFCLLDENTLLYSRERAKNIPVGLVNFIEDKKYPPNRAYLKLWEAFTLLGETPKAGDIAMDLGASPGGWTSVLHRLGAKVIAVDKAELDITLQKVPNIDFICQSAFALNPADFNKIDWLCADIACYPERLYSLVEKWIDSGKVRNMICTIKLQGKTDLEIIDKFKAIPNSRVLHLYHNKHEATFFWSN